MIKFYFADITWWLYVMSIISAAWGFILFSWWWVKTQRASHQRPTSVYICMWIIFAGELIDNLISLRMRSGVISLGFSHSYSFFRSWLWSARVTPELLGMVAIDFIMTYRIIFRKVLFKANGHKSVLVTGGFIEKAVLKDALLKNAALNKLILEKATLKEGHAEEMVIEKAKVDAAVLIDAIIHELDIKEKEED